MKLAGDGFCSLVIALLAGSSLGLVEAMWVMERRVSLGTGVVLLLVGACGYAVCSVLVTIAWSGLVRAHQTTETQWATAAVVPFGIMAGIVALTEIGPSTSIAANIVRVLVAAALGVQVTVLLRRGVRRIALLGRVSTWLATHCIILSLGLVVLVVQRGNWWRPWLGLLVTVLLAAAVWQWQRRRGVRVLVATNALAAACLLLLPVLARGTLPAGKPPRGRPNILLITVDTLRADHVGAYGHATAQTPNMDRMAADGVQFLTALAPVPLTCPSHSSILTGLHPNRHGALHNGRPLAPTSSSLAELLGQNGYRTGAIVSGYTLKDEACGLANRFELYDDNFSPRWWLPDNAAKLQLAKAFGFAAARAGFTLQHLDRPATRTTDLALQWIHHNGQQPFFLWVHYFDPHEPYLPPAPYDRQHDPGYTGRPLGHWYHGVSIEEKEAVVNDPRAVQHMIALYDGEISYVDAQLGRLLDALNASGLNRNTLVILTADHGESLGEHDYYFEHSNYLYAEELRVPLIVLLPRSDPRQGRIAERVQLIDITPTILDYVGLAVPPALDGHSLRPLIAGAAPSVAERPAFAAVFPGAWESGRAIYAVHDKGHKLIWTSPEWRFYGVRVPAKEELYDLTADPAERHNIAAQDPPVLAELRERLRVWRAAETARRPATGLDETTKSRLRSLGYVQ